MTDVLKHPEFSGSIGVARVDITPPVGIYSRTWGSARHDMAEGVHRPLLGSCLVFRESGGTGELVFLALDFGGVWASPRRPPFGAAAVAEAGGGAHPRRRRPRRRGHDDAANRRRYRGAWGRGRLSALT